METESVKEIKKLTKSIEKSNNLWQSFFRGILYGFGVFIGSAILAALAIYILSKIQGWAYIGDAIRKVLEIVGKSKS